MRVNARLDDARAAKFRQLQSSLRVGASEVVKQALDLLHKEQCEGQGAKTKALLASDFVGCADGAEDMSSRYKRHLNTSAGREAWSSLTPATGWR